MDEPIWIERRKWPDISHYPGVDLGDASRVVGDGVDGGTGRDIGLGGTVQAHDEHP